MKPGKSERGERSKLILENLVRAWDHIRREWLNPPTLIFLGVLLGAPLYVIWFVFSDSVTEQHAHGFFGLLMFLLAAILGFQALAWLLRDSK
jgi:hypothetical protein